ncbi:MAG: exopolyphosphatase/guanosine-5'-triphosphate,3'-diphosphate pyrophosphatase [Sphingobacteriales bacterium]|jgi:exopolyphosphatase/guanosine-5'-triphosphate,3'-diphosphate pyrophosphatase
MFELPKYGAIDIGSNAVRLLIAHVSPFNGDFQIKKESLIRVPVRLGEDAFFHQGITPEREARLIHTLQAYNHLIKAHGLVAYKACATAALREAQNGPEIIEKIKQKAGIKIDLITGAQEAQLIAANLATIFPLARRNYLFIDLGGGSTELSICKSGIITQSQSFKLGTLKILHNQDNSAEWNAMKLWIESNALPLKNLHVVGTGGNINKLSKIFGKRENTPVPISFLHQMLHLFSTLSVEERIEIYNLNPSRADVIIPALNVFITILNELKSTKILVPRVGLVDAIVRDLHITRLNKKA